MNKLSTDNRYADIDSLVHITEQWNLVLSEMNGLCEDLATLPLDLATLKQHQDDLLTARHSVPFSKQLSDAEVENIVDYLDRASSKLIQLHSNSKNIIALKEKIEAIQSNKYLYNYNINDELIHFNKSFNSSKKKKIKFNPIEKIKVFKKQYPENFWSAIIAFFLIVSFGYILSTPSLVQTNSSVIQTENTK